MEKETKLTEAQTAALKAVAAGDGWAVYNTSLRTLNALYRRGLVAPVPPEQNAARWVLTGPGHEALKPRAAAPAAARRGRPRVHSSAAEKQRAYRLREKMNA